MEELPTLVQELTEREAGPGAEVCGGLEPASPAAEFPGHTPHRDTLQHSVPQSVRDSHLGSTEAGLTTRLRFDLHDVGIRASSTFCA